jgi:hypothetical protein
MIPADPYGAGDDDLDDLPQLPIPRPGEWSPMAAASQPAEPRLAPPALGGGLGGGASFTASGSDLDGAAGSDAHPGLESLHAERERVEAERFTWELAARLTSGMLANPARGGSSVKDAMGLFDQFLQEMNSYTRIASEFDLLGHEAARRQAHEDYFRQRSGSNTQPTQDHPVPGATPAPTAASPKPEPTQPRPMGDYRPIPPGSRGPYTPGGMVGTPPPEHQPGEGGEQAA